MLTSFDAIEQAARRVVPPFFLGLLDRSVGLDVFVVDEPHPWAGQWVPVNLAGEYDDESRLYAELGEDGLPTDRRLDLRSEPRSLFELACGD